MHLVLTNLRQIPHLKRIRVLPFLEHLIVLMSMVVILQVDMFHLHLHMMMLKTENTIKALVKEMVMTVPLKMWL